MSFEKFSKEIVTFPPNVTTMCTVHVFVYVYTVEHGFNGHVINGIHEVNGKKCYYRAFHLVNKLYDFTGMLDLSGNFCYDDFFRKSHARLYFAFSVGPYHSHDVLLFASGR